jgi:hypothetical protein
MPIFSVGWGKGVRGGGEGRGCLSVQGSSAPRRSQRLRVAPVAARAAAARDACTGATTEEHVPGRFFDTSTVRVRLIEPESGGGKQVHHPSRLVCPPVAATALLASSARRRKEAWRTRMVTRERWELGWTAGGLGFQGRCLAAGWRDGRARRRKLPS